MYSLKLPEPFSDGLCGHPPATLLEIPCFSEAISFHSVSQVRIQSVHSYLVVKC